VASIVQRTALGEELGEEFEGAAGAEFEAPAVADVDEFVVAGGA
jgi:hypothetical protein